MGVAITGCPVERSRPSRARRRDASAPIFRLGYGFAARATAPSTCTRQAASRRCAAPGSYEGGGAFHNNGAIYHWNKTMIEGLDAIDPAIRMLDQSRIGRVLVRRAEALIKARRSPRC
jgi:hypothetical protein